MNLVIRILAGICGAVAGAIFGIIVGLFTATLIVGGNGVLVAFMIIPAGSIGAILGAVVGTIGALLFLSYLRRAAPRRRVISILTLIVAISLSVAGMLKVIRNHDEPPSDQQLLTNFDQHQATFDRLSEMVKADGKLIRVDPDFTDPHDPTTIGISDARIETYRQMLREARVPRGFQAYKPEIEIDFLYWGVGSGTKGYAYVEGPAFGVLAKLDGYQRQPRSDDPHKVYRHIRGNWYLFYDLPD